MKENSGWFKKGVYYPARARAGFKKGNYRGRTRDDWSAKFEELMTQKKLTRRVYAKVTKTHLEIQEKIRENAEALLNELLRLALDGDTSEPTKLNAIQQLMDRGYGKATQTTVNANLNADTKVKDIAANDLERRIEQTLERIEGTAGGVQEKAEGTERSVDLRKLN